MANQSTGNRSRLAAILSPARHAAAFDLLLIAIVAPLAAMLCLSGWGADWPLNSDGVMPYILFDDFFKHGARAGAWVYPLAPYWFPDTALAWAIRCFTSDIFVCVFAYAVIQSALFLLLLRWLFVLVAGRGGRVMWLFWILSWTALVVFGVQRPVGWYAWFYRYIFYPNIHAGTLLVTLLAIGIWIKASAAQNLRGTIALSVFCFVALISDQAFALWFIAPACAALLVPGCESRRWRWQTVASLSCALLAYRLLRHFLPLTYWGEGLSTKVENKRIWKSATALLDDFRQLFAQDVAFSVLEIAAFGALAYVGMISWRRRKESASARMLLRLSMLLFVAIALPTAASVALGRHLEWGAFRYCQPLCLASLAVPIAIRLVLQRFERALLVTLPALVIAVLMIACHSIGTWPFASFRVHDARAAQIECERDVLSKYHARVGFADYWNAMSVMIRIPGASIFPLYTSELIPQSIINANLDLISPSRRPDGGGIEILDEGALDSARMNLLFGAPDERVVCPQSAIRIYRTKNGRPSLLAKLYDRSAYWTTFRRFQITGEVDVPASAWSADSGLDRGDVIVVDGDYSTAKEILSVASDMNPDADEMWVDYEVESAAPNAALSFELFEVNDFGATTRMLAKNKLPMSAGVRRQIVFRFDALGEVPKQVGIRISALGRMKAVIKTVGWNR